MNELAAFLESLMEQINHWPADLQIIAAIWVAGYMIKVFSWLPNRFIPLVALGIAVIGKVGLGTNAQIGPETRWPWVHLAILGILLWGVAWFTYGLGLKRFEKYLPGLKWFKPEKSQFVSDSGSAQDESSREQKDGKTTPPK